MRILGAVALALVVSACTSVKMVQREGCWIKRTEKVFGRVREEIGPCARVQPKWADDQLTRLVQECVAQADWRWQARAIDAWSRSKPYPAQPPQEETLRTCMQESRIGLVSENDELKRRMSTLEAERETLRADLAAERSVLRSDADKERLYLRGSNDRIAQYLGDAALRPPASANVTATATATGEGSAANDSGATLASTSDSGASGPARAPPPTSAPVTAVPTTPVGDRREAPVTSPPETPVAATPEAPAAATPEAPAAATPEAPAAATPEAPAAATPEAHATARPETPLRAMRGSKRSVGAQEPVKARAARAARPAALRRAARGCETPTPGPQACPPQAVPEVGAAPPSPESGGTAAPAP